MTGQTTDYGVGNEVVDNVEVNYVDSNSFNLTTATSNKLYLDGGYNSITLATGVGANTLNLTVDEDATNGVDEATATDFEVRLSVDNDGDADIRASGFTGTQNTNYDQDQDDGGNTEYTLTQLGTYVVADVDDYNQIEFWMPQDEDDEVSYGVFIAPTGAQTMVSGGGSAVTTQMVNPVAVGAAVLDSDVQLATATTNLVVVGGPCINSVAAELLGNPVVCNEGFEPGKAFIELFDLDNGEVAMLVAGYEALETQAASRAVATDAAGLQGDAVVLTVTSLNDYSIAAKE
jgi:S-layer protein (TIGR01564 family)